MELSKIIEKFTTDQARMKAALPKTLRPFLAEHPVLDARSGMIVGPRGVGKTTMLLLACKPAGILYISADDPVTATFSLSQIADAAFSEGFDGLVIDEVHHAKDWSLHVKSIYDRFPNKKIWISDSSSLILRKGVGDLSRRMPRMTVPFLSFREYLCLGHGLTFETFDPFTAPIEAFERVATQCNVLKLFKRYCQEGFRPIFLEGDYHQKIIGIIEKSIYTDIPYFVPRIQENHLRLMNAIMGFLAISPIPTINIESMSKEWSLGKEKLYQLLNVMEHVGLLQIVRFKSDHSAAGKGSKLFFADPSMYSALSGAVGNVREAFVVTMFRQMGRSIFACKNEGAADFEFDQVSIEVGGPNKARKKANFVIRDDLDLPGQNSIPMWSLGMMY